MLSITNVAEVAHSNIDREVAVMTERMKQFTAATTIQDGTEVVEAQHALVKAESGMSAEHAREMQHVVSLRNRPFVENEKIMEEKLAVQLKAWKQFEQLQPVVPKRGSRTC